MAHARRVQEPSELWSARRVEFRAYLRHGGFPLRQTHKTPRKPCSPLFRRAILEQEPVMESGNATPWGCASLVISHQDVRNTTQRLSKVRIEAEPRIGHPPVISKPLPSLALPTRLPLALPFAAAFLLGQRAMSTIRRIIAHLVGERGSHPGRRPSRARAGLEPLQSAPFLSPAGSQAD